MCHGCHVEYGSPALDTAAIRLAALLVKHVYEFSCVGGNGHIVFDDWNIDDSSIEWCLNTAIVENFHKAGADQIAVERAALEAFRTLTLEQRASALAMHDGYYDPDAGHPYN